MTTYQRKSEQEVCVMTLSKAAFYTIQGDSIPSSSGARN